MIEKILVIDDDQGIRYALSEALRKSGYLVDLANSAEEALQKIRTVPYELLLLDVRLPGMSGIDALPLFKQIDPGVDIIVITGHGTKDVGLQAIQMGAYDYFTKPFSLKEIEIVIKRAMAKRHLESEIKSLREEIKQGGKLIGQSEGMKAVKALITRIAPLDTTVLITGESGTGKELVAEMIHDQSRRAGGPLVKVNCAAIPETMLETELFGHEKGAFTGAHILKQGKFELANKGSLVLDEVGEMPISIQGKLLRAVEQKEVDRLGGKKPLAVDVRLIASTNRDLQELIAEKQFRGDLYYRLNVAAVHLPPLRERREDIPLLAQHLLDKINFKLGMSLRGISKDGVGCLLAYHWPGNVRELANVLERAAISGSQEVLTLSDLQSLLQRSNAVPHSSSPGGAPISLSATLEEIERAIIAGALQKTAGVQVKAAELLGLTPKNLWKKMRTLGISSDKFKRH